MDGEDAALSDGARDIKQASMTTYDMLDDREPEAGSAHGARTRGVNSVKTLGQAGEMFVFYAFTAIAH